MPVTTRITTVQVVAEKNSRRASELRRIARWSEEIAKPAHGLYDIDAELFAHAADEHFDGIGVAIEILVVEMLDQFAARDDAAGAGVEAHGAAIELALGVTSRTTQERADAR